MGPKNKEDIQKELDECARNFDKQIRKIYHQCETRINVRIRLQFDRHLLDPNFAGQTIFLELEDRPTPKPVPDEWYIQHKLEIPVRE